MISSASAPLKLTICGIDELEHQCVPGVTHVLSILDPGWPEPEPIRNFDLNRRLKLHFHDVIEPMPGWIAPERWDVELLLAFGRKLNETVETALAGPNETHLLVHCHAGVSRSTAAAILLLAQQQPSQAAHDIVGQVIRCGRGMAKFADHRDGRRFLGRDGEIVASVGCFIDWRSIASPDWLKR